MKLITTQKYLSECFDYNLENGSLVWRQRPTDHFKSARVCHAVNASRAGIFAGSINTAGSISVRLNKMYQWYAHRIIWCMVTGIFPTRSIQHLNGNKTDNRWINLQLRPTQ